MLDDGEEVQVADPRHDAEQERSGDGRSEPEDDRLAAGLGVVRGQALHRAVVVVAVVIVVVVRGDPRGAARRVVRLAPVVVERARSPRVVDPLVITRPGRLSYRAP